MAANKPIDITACPDWGKGGSYTLDPATGIRTLVQRTAPAEDQAAAPSAVPADSRTASDVAPPAVQSVKKGT